MLSPTIEVKVPMPSDPVLSKDVIVKLDELLQQSGEAERGGDLNQSLTQGQVAWDILPEPKASWDFYPQIIARGMLRKFTAKRDIDQVKAWLQLTYEAYADSEHNNHFVNMLEGSVWRSLGDDNNAYTIFEKIYNREGRNGFRGENINHLEWFLKQRAQRRG
ncbi:hypothetical protein [Methylobacterium sp. Leaf469]|uniref:hypothetical protein n=1 Tax=Methylobacterium sp. Leaf469 TaxID=1736387 RepID=UPI000B2115C4|nr:hypothetical protein [Methylobacterium sp. Leaf469]